MLFLQLAMLAGLSSGDSADGKNICQGAQVINFPKMDLGSKDTRVFTIWAFHLQVQGGGRGWGPVSWKDNC